MVLRGAEIITEILKEQEVDRVFGYPGGAVLEIYDALEAEKNAIKHILTAHEQGAAHAADGYARATGKTGVVIATSGPGATNLVTGIATAYMDSVPMVAITGNVPTNMIGKDSFQEVYIAGITLPITKHNFVVRNVSDLADTLRKAFYLAQTGRKGPVLVDVPRDVAWSLCEFTPGIFRQETPETLPSPSDLQAAADLINQAKRPVVLYGGGAKYSANALLSFMKKASVPGVHTLMSVSTLPFDEPLNLGLAGLHGNAAAEQAILSSDLVIAVGTRFSDRLLREDRPLAPGAKILHIDTDPSEIGKNIPVDMSLVGDTGMILSRLEPLIEKKSRKLPVAKRPENALFTAMEEVFPNAVYTTDVGLHQMMAVRYVRHKSPGHFITSGGLGTMGFGYGAAIGASMGLDCPVLHLTGDGSFHMNLIEAATAVTYHTPVVSVIFNDRALGMVRRQQLESSGRIYATDVARKTDYVKLAEGFGLKGYSCGTAEEFRRALEQAAGEGPAWIELRLYEGGFDGIWEKKF